jgi:hypothetical protein
MGKEYHAGCHHARRHIIARGGFIPNNSYKDERKYGEQQARYGNTI